MTEVKETLPAVEDAAGKARKPKWFEEAQARGAEWLKNNTKRSLVNYMLIEKYKCVECHSVIMTNDNDDETKLVIFTYSKENRVMRIFHSVEATTF
jgi:predicted HAD superfamily phosphohydrolase YqeG